MRSERDDESVAGVREGSVTLSSNGSAPGTGGVAGGDQSLQCS